MLRFPRISELPASLRRGCGTTVLLFGLSLSLLITSAQTPSERLPSLPRERFKSGAWTLRAFDPLAEAARGSVVVLERNGKTVALGTIIDANGLVASKASELSEGKLTCKLADGTELEAELLVADEDNDVALVQIQGQGFKAIEWAVEDPGVGQWVATPGIGPTPEAVGVVSVPPRKILHKQALIGVQLDFTNGKAAIEMIRPGLGAEKAGLKPGDIILAVNDTTVETGPDAVNTLRQFREGQMVKLRVQREAEEFEVTIRMMLPPPEPRGRGADRQERMNRLGGELSQRAEGFEIAIQHDTVLQPWQCGGPLLNLEGKAIGLNIARAGRVASYALPASLMKQIIDKLKSESRLQVL